MGIRAVLLLLFALALAGCGGGGGGGESAPAGCSATMQDPGACAPAISLTLVDASGAASAKVSPEHPGTLKALVRNEGLPVANVPVTFTTTDSTGSFVPISGSALSGADGIAQVDLPAGAQVGAFTVTAEATVAFVDLSDTTGYAVEFPLLTLSTMAITPERLSAGGNASVSVTVLADGAVYQPPLEVNFTSPCVVAGKASLGTPVLTRNGVAAASYTDKGCAVPDTITASVQLGGRAATQTGVITVLPPDAGAISFVSADSTNIALKGTGGVGRQEYSTLKFKVTDKTGNVSAGTMVDFEFANLTTTPPTAIGGLTLFPASAIADADGFVTTLITAGTVPTSIRLMATVRGTQITTLSSVLVVSTGIPDQNHFSLSTSIGNCEGRDFDQFCSTVTATMGDHFGNPVPDGTAVNFTAEGGVIDASCLTGSLPAPGTTPPGETTNSKLGPGSGSCSVTLRSSAPRKADERITVLAYALGEETFVDVNGNNVCDGCDAARAGSEFLPANDMSPDIYRDDDENLAWTRAEPCVGPNANGSCTSPGDGKYNGVLRNPKLPSPQTLYVSAQLVQTFSGSTALISFDPAAPACAPGQRSIDIDVLVTDVARNIMPAETRIDFAVDINDPKGVIPALATVNNVVYAVGDFSPVLPHRVAVSCAASKLFVTATTPNGIETRSSVAID